LTPHDPLPAQAPACRLGSISDTSCQVPFATTPAPIIARLDGEIAKAVALPGVRAAFAKLGIEIFYMNSGQLGTFLRSEAVRFKSLLKHSRVLKPPQ
jgi:tripartite-type tricarboxylate transporter receptor subunit TctC